jgi:hypothetical protein
MQLKVMPPHYWLSIFFGFWGRFARVPVFWVAIPGVAPGCYMSRNRLPALPSPSDPTSQEAGMTRYLLDMRA